MLGDDVVDLADPDASEGALHPRFDARAFTLAERALLARAADRGALRWALWAAKEAAYKAAHRLDPSVRFHPRAFAVDGGVVRHRAARFSVTFRRRGPSLHAVAVPLALAPVCLAAGCGLLAAGESPSAGARRLALRAAARRLGCPEGELAVARAGRVPHLLRAGVACGGALSLSHHGAFAGFALLLPEIRA